MAIPLFDSQCSRNKYVSVHTSKRSLGLPTAANRYCQSAISVLRAQCPTVCRNSGNCLMNSTTCGRRASVCVCGGGGGGGGGV